MHEQFKDLVDRLNNATNEIATDLQKLRDQISGGLSKEEAEVVVASLTPIIEQLEALGTDPTDPVP